MMRKALIIKETKATGHTMLLSRTLFDSRIVPTPPKLTKKRASAYGINGESDGKVNSRIYLLAQCSACRLTVCA